MKKFILPVALSSLLLTACSAEWKSERDLGDEAFEKGNFESALKHYETSLKMKETDTTKEKIKETSERIEKIKAEEAEKEKKLVEEKKKKDEENKQRKAEAKVKLDAYIKELVDSSDGMIKDVQPGTGDTWMTTFVIIDTDWHLMDRQQKEQVANVLAPAIEQAIIGTGITSECFVHFYDTNGVHLVEPKGFGGYGVKQ